MRNSPNGPVVAAISMVGPTPRVVGDRETRHVRLLESGARRLSAAIATGSLHIPPTT